MLLERPWKIDALLRLLMLVCLSISISVLLMLIGGKTLSKTLSSGDFEFAAQVAGFVSIQGLGLVWLAMFLSEHEVTWATAFGLRRAPARSMGLAFLTMLVAHPVTVVIMGTVAALLLRLFGIAPETQITVNFLKQHPPVWQVVVLGFVAVVLAPLAEEMFFRGVLYTTLRQRGYPRLALWGSATLFGIIHFNLAALCPLIFLALVWTWLYERTGNLLAPITAHVLFNAVNFVALIADLPDWLARFLEQ